MEVEVVEEEVSQEALLILPVGEEIAIRSAYGLLGWFSAGSSELGS